MEMDIHPEEIVEQFTPYNSVEEFLADKKEYEAGRFKQVAR